MLVDERALQAAMLAGSRRVAGARRAGRVRSWCLLISSPADLTEYIPRIAPRPFMLIHAAHGEVGNKTPEYLAAARGPAEHWEVPKGGHTAGITTMPDEYARRILDFFDRTLRARAT